MVVMGIIGLLAATAVPAIRSLTQSNTMASGSRQLLDDLSYARQLALNGRRTVYMVFVPVRHPRADEFRPSFTGPDAAERNGQYAMLTNSLRLSQYTGYALFTRRTVGDQPGRGSPSYLTPWKQLPDGLFFTTNRFVDYADKWATVADALPLTNRPLPFAAFPFPAGKQSDLPAPIPRHQSQGAGGL